MIIGTSKYRVLANIIATFVPGVRTIPFALRYRVFRRVYYSPEYNFSYFRLPKCANSTVVMTLHTAMSLNAGHPVNLAGGYQDSDDAKRQAKRGLGPYVFNGYFGRKPFTFTFVRDPRVRMLSCYLDKIAEPQKRYRDVLNMDMRRLSFLDFMNRLEEGFLHADTHWAPQSDLIPAGGVDYLGRVESLQEDLVEIGKRLFGMENMEVITKTVGRSNSAKRLTEYYGDAEEKLVRKIYRRDFELFYPQLL